MLYLIVRDEGSAESDTVFVGLKQPIINILVAKSEFFVVFKVHDFLLDGVHNAECKFLLHMELSFINGFDSTQN